MEKYIQSKLLGKPQPNSSLLGALNNHHAIFLRFSGVINKARIKSKLVNKSNCSLLSPSKKNSFLLDKKVSWPYLYQIREAAMYILVVNHYIYFNFFSVFCTHSVLKKMAAKIIQADPTEVYKDGSGSGKLDLTPKVNNFVNK